MNATGSIDKIPTAQITIGDYFDFFKTLALTPREDFLLLGMKLFDPTASNRAILVVPASTESGGKTNFNFSNAAFNWIEVRGPSEVESVNQFQFSDPEYDDMYLYGHFFLADAFHACTCLHAHYGHVMHSCVQTYFPVGRGGRRGKDR